MKLCIDCVHFVEGDPHTCARTGTNMTSPVDGKITTSYMTCEKERAPKDFSSIFFNCGPSGVYWELK